MIEQTQWEFENYGFHCLIMKHQGCKTNYFTGYVNVPPGHPWYGHDNCMEMPLVGVEVHGGITYASKTHDGFFRVGFDTNHVWSKEWDLDQALRETSFLAKQAKEAQNKAEEVTLTFRKDISLADFVQLLLTKLA